MADAAELATKYDRAAGQWSDKMRLLGYYDAYLGFLSHVNFRAPAGNRVLDVGCGTGAFADAWAAIHGPHQDIALLDPSAEMLDRAAVALRRRAIDATRIQGLLEEHEPVEPYHCLLAAHVIEHAAVAVDALREMRALVPNGGRLWLVVSKPHWCNAIIWFQWRHRAYRPSDVHHMLADSGWALEAEYPFPSGPPSRTSRGYLAKAV